MNKTDDILHKLSAIEQPAIDNPDALTDLIMSSLPEQAAPKKTQDERAHALLLTMRAISSIAAVWLVGLFFVVNDETPVTPVVVHQSPNDAPSFCEGSTPGEIYTCYMQRKREQSGTYSLIKKRIYESHH
jgi:hypothetical protein